MTAQDQGWGEPGLSRTTRVDCPGIPLNVRPEVAPLFAELVRWLTQERAKAGVPPLRSAGGYVKRRIRGSRSAWSNHSWGLAVDFNPDTNPLGMRLKTDMPRGTSLKAKSLGMRWGGDYRGRKDAMHFEFVGTPADARRLIAALRTPVTRPDLKEYDVISDEDVERIAAAVHAKTNPDIVTVLRGTDQPSLTRIVAKLDAIAKAVGVKA